MANASTKFDGWLDEAGPAALVLREHLMSVEGKDGVVFPSTFASIGYNIDEFPNGRNVCLIDSVGSQANRLEPIFMEASWRGLVPQIVIRAGTHRVNVLEAGHRAGDALARCANGLSEDLQRAFLALQAGDAEPMAKLAPTSLVFGVWDSRGTQAKAPRLLSSTIRAFDVVKLTRSAQYVPAVPYVEEGLLDEPPDKKTRDAYAERGFIHVPATGSHGGVIAKGGIRRDASVHLAALRLLRTADAGQVQPLRRYILGLALVAFTHGTPGFLRQGCNLVKDPDVAPDCKAVFGDGLRESVELSFNEAVEYARAAASDFGIDPNRQIPGTPDREVEFSGDLAREDVSPEAAEKGKKKRKGAAKKG
jgi:CRISPR-associated protein Csb1